MSRRVRSRRARAMSGRRRRNARIPPPRGRRRTTSRWYDVRYRELEQQVAQRRGVQDEGVEKRHGDRQRRSVAHVEFLGVGDQFVERTAPGGVHFVLVSQEVVDAHAAVCPDLAEGKGALFEEPDEEGT